MDLKRVRAAALTGQSSLYRELLDNYISFRAILEKADGRPSWHALAAAFAEDGLRDENGNPPSHVTVRSTWLRVEKAIEARAIKAGRKKPAGRPKPPEPGIVRAVSRGLRSSLPLPPSEYVESPKLFDRSKVKMARPRSQMSQEEREKS